MVTGKAFCCNMLLHLGEMTCLSKCRKKNSSKRSDENLIICFAISQDLGFFVHILVRMCTPSVLQNVDDIEITFICGIKRSIENAKSEYILLFGKMYLWYT